MAQGDIRSDLQNIVASGMLTIQPPAGEEWIIHNLYYTGQVQIRLVKGGNYLMFDSDTSSGARLGMVFHLTNGQYMQILNTGASAINIAYDGITTK